MTGSPLFPELEAELARARAEHTRLLAEILAAESEYTKAFRARETAQGRWGAVVTRVNRACSSGSIEGGGPAGTLSPALGRLLDRERTLYDDAGRTLTKAKRHLEQLRWELSCKSDDVVSIERLIYPPKSPVVKDAAEKPAVPQIDDADIIYFPPSRAA